MKTRSDFVSNSSSCSFVIDRVSGGNVSGIAFLAKTIDETDIPYDIENEISITIDVKRKWRKNLLDFLDMEDDTEKYERNTWLYGDSKPKPTDITYIHVSISDLIRIGKEPTILDMVESVQFQCEDSSNIGELYLGLMYGFFERYGCHPDATESEQSFLGGFFSDFMRKLATVYPKEPEKEYAE